ncbi:hypothetical protein WN943_010937 [Citrus x changshan-huyou]
MAAPSVAPPSIGVSITTVKLNNENFEDTIVTTWLWNSMDLSIAATTTWVPSSSEPNSSTSDLSTKKTIGGRHEMNGVYHLSTSLPSTRTTFSSIVSSEQWHYQLEHPPLRLLHQLGLPVDKKGSSLDPNLLSTSPPILSPVILVIQPDKPLQDPLAVPKASDLDLSIALRKVISLPKHYPEALTHPGWRSTMKEEIKALSDHDTWDLQTLPKDKGVVGCHWLKNLLKELRVEIQGPSVMYWENKAATYIASNPVYHERTKHIEVDCHFIREQVMSGVVVTPYIRSNVWELVPKPEHQSIISTKWVFKNKMDESGVLVRNKARLVAQDYNQEEGIDFDETFALVARLSKALYGLKQAPRAWYDRLKNFLLDNDFSMGKADTTLFVKHKNQDILIVQIYVDDIIFGSTIELLCKDFSSCMSQEFEMSMMGELKYFLGLQIKQNEEGIFINQAKYVKDLLKRFGYDNGTTKSTPMSTTIKLDKDEKGKEVDIKMYRDIGLLYPRGTHIDLTCYSDADFAGYKVDRKITSGTCYILRHSLVSWFSKKQNSVALSTTEAEYIAAGSCCAQALWMKQTLRDYGINLEQIPIKCDNTSAINLSKNTIQHSRTKHIEIRHHFLRDHIQKGDIALEFISTEKQLVDIFTKPLCEE